MNSPIGETTAVAEKTSVSDAVTKVAQPANMSKKSTQPASAGVSDPEGQLFGRGESFQSLQTRSTDDVHPSVHHTASVPARTTDVTHEPVAGGDAEGLKTQLNTESNVVDVRITKIIQLKML